MNRYGTLFLPLVIYFPRLSVWVHFAYSFCAYVYGLEGIAANSSDGSNLKFFVAFSSRESGL